MDIRWERREHWATGTSGEMRDDWSAIQRRLPSGVRAIAEGTSRVSCRAPTSTMKGWDPGNAPA